ncbi:protein SRC2 homolog [Tasmannia lanceolata]|uniref:protein SRC2 homolog n=1 Tax=Tasmannia lanceolata TaxID=3420 RepID=UPI0040641FCA
MSEHAEPTLELTIISAEGLKGMRFLGKMKTWAVAWIEPRLKKSTKTLKDSGTNPTWNQTLSFPLSPQTLQNPNSCITLQVLSSSSPILSHTKVVGSAIMALPGIGSGTTETVTLQLWRPSGRALGLIKVCVRIEGDIGVFGAQDCVTGIPVRGDQIGLFCDWNLSTVESGFVPVVPTAPPLPLEGDNVRRNFLVGLLSGAVAAMLVGAAVS